MTIADIKKNAQDRMSKSIETLRADLAKVLTLRVDPKSYWIYTNTPVDNERVSAIFGQYGFEEGLDRLAASA